MTIKHLRSLICIALHLSWVAPASALVLFQDNFNTDTSLSWTKNSVPAANAGTQTAEFAFNYGDFGIPAAPGSADTLGLRLRANVPADTSRPPGVLSGLSMSPTGKNFGTDYKAEFYVWSNFFGAANATGLGDNANSQGGSANVLFALGTTGTVPQAVGQPNAITGSTIDGVTFATTGDGAIADDYRVFVKSPNIATAASGVYAAGTVNDAGGQTPTSNSNVFYTSKFPSQTAPAVQQDLATAEYGADAFPVMAGSTPPGSFGFAWHKVTLTKSGNSVTWDVDDNRFATVDVSAVALGGNNIALGVSDVNATTARHPSLVFTVFDNLQVEDIAPVGVSGDYNNNGTVDAADYVVWRNAGPADTLPNDTTPGTVNGADYDLWKSRFGATSGSGSLAGSAVPEPSTVFLLAVGGLYFCMFSRRPVAGESTGWRQPAR
jgi:hypothetical protein